MSDPCVLEPEEINALIEVNRMVDPTGAGVDDLPAGVEDVSSGSTSASQWENDYALVALTFEEYDQDMFEMSRA